MKNIKAKSVEEKKIKKQVLPSDTLEVPSDFADEINWESEIVSLQGRSFASMDEALTALAETAVSKITPGAVCREQVAAVTSILRDNEDICEFVEKVLLRNPR